MLLDREFLKTLEQVELLCRSDLAGGAGAHVRPFTYGAGLEFADYRHYSSGEDFRYLDWNAYLRLGKLFLKVYAAEQNIRVYLLLDCSASMDCEEGEESKLQYSKRLAATFAYLALLRLDTTVLVPFAESIQTPRIVSGGRNHFWPVLEYLETLTARGRTDLRRSVQAFLQRFPTRGTVILISDFFDDTGCQSALEMLRSAGHDFVLVQVHSAREQRPQSSGQFRLEEAETGEQRLITLSPESSEAYERDFLQWSNDLQRLALRQGGRYARAVTSIPYQEFVLRSLQGNRVVA
ncbi:MAG: DUF58 domain-containing protein [Candidatus Korobacteraceae bacterium]